MEQPIKGGAFSEGLFSVFNRSMNIHFINIPKIIIVFHIAGIPFPLVSIGFKPVHLAIGFRDEEVCNPFAKRMGRIPVVTRSVALPIHRVFFAGDVFHAFVIERNRIILRKCVQRVDHSLVFGLNLIPLIINGVKLISGCMRIGG